MKLNVKELHLERQQQEDLWEGRTLEGIEFRELTHG